MIDLAFFETGLTVGQIAGIIAGVLSTVQFGLPLVYAVVVIGMIQSGSHNAATWSVISHLLQSSLWPMILRADAAASGDVRNRVNVVALLGVLWTVSHLLAGYLTPISLTEVLRPSKHVRSVQFEYVPDQSFYGLGTLARPSKAISRICGWSRWSDCPDSIYDDPLARIQYPGHIVINSTIPFSTAEPFSTGTIGSTIAGPLDIQFRNWYERRDIFVDNNELDTVGIFRPLATFVLDDSYRIVEGLIVDAVNGGLGFRNHTIPKGLELGAQWAEEILWLTPETSCTSTNLTLHFSISEDYFYRTGHGYMQDDGGFANLDPNIPTPRWDDDGSHWRSTSNIPDLQQRSYTAAWWNNQFVAQALNISTSDTGQIYTSEFSKYADLVSPYSININDMNGLFLDSIWYNNSHSNEANFTTYGDRCSGYYDTYQSSSSIPYIRCGYLYGMPYPANISNGQPYRSDLGSPWAQQVYICASSLKASVKSVTFSTNGTESLDGLVVNNIQDKAYENGNLPFWAIEKVHGYQIQDIHLLWGLVNETYINQSNIETRRAAEIYLPASGHTITYGHIYDTFAAGMAFTAAWNSLYANAASVSGISVDFIPSYSGETNYALTLKWRELSKTPRGAAKILNLIWTDLAASATVGTKMAFESQQQQIPSTESGRIPSAVNSTQYRNVYPYVRIVQYNDIRYAIPAFVIGGILVIGLIPALIMGCFRVVRWRTLIHYVNHTSMGRAVTQVTDPVGSQNVSTKDWWRGAGRKTLDIPRVGEAEPNHIRISSSSDVSDTHNLRRPRESSRTGRTSDRQPFLGVEDDSGIRGGSSDIEMSPGRWHGDGQ